MERDNTVTRMNTFEKLTALKQPKRQFDTSKILTTPESIVRQHRRVVRLRTKDEREATSILGRHPEPAPWHRKIDWGFTHSMIAVGCGAALMAVGLYLVTWVLIPLLRMIRWQ